MSNKSNVWGRTIPGTTYWNFPGLTISFSVVNGRFNLLISSIDPDCGYGFSASGKCKVDKDLGNGQSNYGIKVGPMELDKDSIRLFDAEILRPTAIGKGFMELIQDAIPWLLEHGAEDCSYPEFEEESD